MPSRQSEIVKQRWVVKIGSSMLIEGGTELLRELFRQVQILRNERAIEVIWVTSGAIATARERFKKNWGTVSEKQALSSIGQPLLMDAYNSVLQPMGLVSGQVLLTYDDIRRAHSRRLLKKTLQTLLEWQVIPVLNENDAVSNDEIKFGDNDMLSAKIACLMEAQRLVLLTNTDGIYDKNPKQYADGQRIPRIQILSDKVIKTLDLSGASDFGTGGMASKLKAAQLAQAKSVETRIIRADHTDGLLQIAEDADIGTCIPARKPKKSTGKAA